MVGWIMGICGVVVFGVVLDTIMPEGEMQKFIKSIFALIAVFVIVSPIKSLVSTDFSYSYPSSSVQTDQAYLTALYKSQIRVLENAVEQDITNMGYGGVEVTIMVNEYSSTMYITGVTINTNNLVIKENAPHIFNYNEIVDKVCERLGVDKGIIARL